MNRKRPAQVPMAKPQGRSGARRRIRLRSHQRASRTPAGLVLFYAKSDIRMVDESALLETLRALRTFHTMTKPTFLRSLLAAIALAAAPFLAVNSHGAVGDILKKEGNSYDSDRGQTRDHCHGCYPRLVSMATAHVCGGCGRQAVHRYTLPEEQERLRSGLTRDSLAFDWRAISTSDRPAATL